MNAVFSVQGGLQLASCKADLAYFNRHVDNLLPDIIIKVVPSDVRLWLISSCLG